MKTPVRAAMISAALLIGPVAASASTTVIGNGYASECSRQAIDGRYDRATLELCSQALSELLPRDDAAKTYVNRGVVYLRRKEYENAERDLVAAERLANTLPEVFVNQGAVRIAQRRFEEALVLIDRGIALKPAELEKAYYNRALAHEGLDDVKGAYLDYKRALDLKPDWQQPKTELLRFTVQAPSPR
jgi:tetratricopeptide (TPR) repeat protein